MTKCHDLSSVAKRKSSSKQPTHDTSALCLLEIWKRKQFLRISEAVANADVTLSPLARRHAQKEKEKERERNRGRERERGRGREIKREKERGREIEREKEKERGRDRERET